jgi:hypothetical protein
VRAFVALAEALAGSTSPTNGQAKVTTPVTA